MKRGYTLVELLIVVTIIGILAALLLGTKGCPVGCNSDYSEGERVGVVTKLSHKGFQYKTWEGQMNLGGMARGQDGKYEPNVWAFTIPDDRDDLIKIVQEAQRSQKPVIITYKEWMIRPGCQTDSGFMVQDVQYVKEEKPAK